MRIVFLAISFMTLPATTSLAAPALGDKPKWEYAELTYRSISGRPARVDAVGNPIAATPDSADIHLTTGTGEIEVKSWFELAEKLKIAGFKKDGSPSFQKIQVLNFLGGEGWEIIEQSSGSPITQVIGGPAGPGGGVGARATVRTSAAGNTWMLKRRVP